MPTGPQADLDDAAAVFAGVRPRLFGIAYRMLGTTAEAEDVVQDAWLRWQACDRAAVLNPPAFLATTTTRLAINAAQSARARRETYIGPWLPEPVDTAADPALGAERGEALEFAILVLLERLTPTERAAYVLREAFDYSYPEIGDVVGVKDSNARQLVSRARKHVNAERREPVGSAEQRRLLTAFLAAAQQGDLAALEEILAADVVSYSDGGGAVRASRIPVVGRTHVSRYVAAFAKPFWTGASLTWVEANGQASVLVARDGEVFALVTLTASAEGVGRLMWVMNPAKLRTISTAVSQI
ncbi:RNA polymerase sigma-70 factor [Umezawaea sp. Da 62-37]|uniref:RNA polymerase sigma-70 factor n=1 Tax=Umezawaea sp. Da 62-37 TaxID=3075927 RepID=UPI0028F6F327|nr:RNA polymerase sigma-70 factor [Umezawaea sp. Da 62-37]WNV86413.1 RNA polymerase sigma-70 factor [Umezawaea sp. Da 62-37]